jgi:hypothetical protein
MVANQCIARPTSTPLQMKEAGPLFSKFRWTNRDFDEKPEEEMWWSPVGLSYLPCEVMGKSWISNLLSMIVMGSAEIHTFST